MSIYDDVKAAAGVGPAYPNKSAFTTIYGYAGGKCLGTFESVDVAKKAGAVTTERNTDDAAYRKEKTAFDDFEAAIRTSWLAQVRAQYPMLNDASFNAVYDMAYDRGHSSGFGEVELYISDYVDFAEKIIASVK